MIIANEFQGDSIRIARIQHDSYGEALRIIVDFAARKHRHAEKVIASHTDFSELRDNIKSFDHRTLQWLHDFIAAAFRMNYCLKADLFTYATVESHTSSEVISFWFDFLNKELERIFIQHLELPRLILTAVVYPNPSSKGADAEDEIYRLAKHLYPELKSSQA